MAPKRATRSNIAQETTNTTSVINAQLQAMINQGVTAALAARDANRNTNGDDSHISGAGVRRTERTAHEFALTWWNTHVKTVGHDAAYGYWTNNLYQRFHELACCQEMFPEESNKIEKYVGGLPDMIHGSVHGSVVASKPKTIQEATEMAIEVMDKRICTFDDRQTKNKRKQDNNQQLQQQHQNKR
ncbi:hypothetical protein Tco_0331787 [Tanacetum coccineum]